MNSRLSIGQCATLACLLEVAAPKPGNVHRAADFPDCGLVDFLASAVAIGPIMESARETGVGGTVLACIRATSSVCRTNTNLGLVLLLAPMAAADPQRPPRTGVEQVLHNLSAKDARNVYEAIQLANPGGLQPKEDIVKSHPVGGDIPVDLLAAMREASERDLIARQYTNGFEQVFELVLPALTSASASLTERIILTHLQLMSEYPDSLIRRKAGLSVATEAAARAARVLEAGPYASDEFEQAIADFDFWLRSDGNRRNPGTTADLIAAGLFAGLREGTIEAPYG
jgi:triphosphoribosyl-dephospho-CoA synthase